MPPVLVAKNLAKTYETGGAKVLGLRGVDISIGRRREAPPDDETARRQPCLGGVTSCRIPATGRGQLNSVIATSA